MLAPSVHRFSQANLTTHGWMLERLVSKYPSKNEIGWANFIRSLSFRNDCLAIVQQHSIALAEVVQTDSLSGKKVCYERFVWCEDKQNADQIEAAAALYDEIRKWAKSQGIEEMVIARDTDIPLEMIKARLGRVYVTDLRCVKV